MKQFLLKLTKYGLIVLLLLNLISWSSLYILGKSNFYKPQFIKNGVKEKYFDYVVLGSSTGLTTLNTKQIDSTTGKKGLNISMDDSVLSSQYLMLEYFYALNKKTKCLVLAISPSDIENAEPELNNNDYRFLPHVSEKCVFDYYRNIEQSNLKVLTLSKYFPILGISYYNTELFFPSMVSILQPKKRNRFDDKGNYSYPDAGAIPKANQTKVMAKFTNPYFIKIQQFCIQNKIKLILYQPPIFKTKVIVQNMENVVNHSDLLEDSKFFYDNIHVNNKGRQICSDSLAKILK